MRFGIPVLAALLAVGAASGAMAQPRHYDVTIAPAGTPAKGFQKTRVSAATVGTAPIRVWFNTSIDPDCSPHVPGAGLTVLEAPQHGEATVRDEPFFAAYPPNNPRAVCNTRKVPGHQAFYTAAAGFKGHDHLVLQGVNPDSGRVREIDVDVEVR